MSDKTQDWAAMDKRIRDRKIAWSKKEREALDKGLNGLPDLAEQVEVIDMPQPALGSSQEEESAEQQEGGDGEGATSPTESAN